MSLTAMIVASRVALKALLTSTGQLRSPSQTQGIGGGTITSWANYGDTFLCNLQPMKSTEVPEGLSLRGQTVFSLYVPVTVNMTPTMRLVVAGAEYAIHEVQPERTNDLVRKAIVSRLSAVPSNAVDAYPPSDVYPPDA